MSGSKNQVPFGHKVAFGVGMLANQMFPASLGIFMVVLVQNLGFPGWMYGVVYFLPRLLDAITDPIMGYISDNTKSRWGRRKQYVIIGSLVMGAAFAVMWQLYGENSTDYNFLYFLVWSFAFYIGLTIFSVPYVAIGYEMSDDFHERTQIMAIAQWIGQWAWVIAPWFWVIMYDPSWFSTPETATRELAVWVAVIFTLCAMVPGLFIPAKSTLEENYPKLSFKAIKNIITDIFAGFREAFASTPFRKLCISTFFIYNAFMTIAGFSFFIIVWHLFNGKADAAGYWTPLFGSAGALVTTFVVIPIVASMSKKIGKKKAFMYSQGIAIIGYVSLWFLFVPGKPWMFLIALPFHSFGIGSLFTLMMSMTADVIDLDELNYGVRREGVFGAIYWYMVKFGFAIAGGLSGVILSVVGFDGQLDAQPEGAITGLRLFFSGLPILGTLVSLWVMRDYDLTEERSNEIRAALDKRKNESELTSAHQAGKLASLVELNGKLAYKSPVDFSDMTPADIRELFGKTLKSGMHGICFSPYKEGQNVGDQLTENQIERRMKVIKQHTNWVRSFSTTEGNEFTPKVASQNGLKTMVGAWVSNDRERTKQELESLIELCKAGHVDIAVVGNEVLLREELSEEEIIAYMDFVRKAVPGVPVAYIDAYYQFIQRPALAEACDVLLVNCYPFWEGCDIDDASAYLQYMYHLVKEKANGKEVIIAETGWPGEGSSVLGAVPSEANAIKYFINTTKWQQEENVPVFYFSSFDESWKARLEGDVGARWGLWDKNEKLKYN